MFHFAKPAKIAALALAAVALATSLPTPSQAGNNTGAAIAAGVVGGLVVGGLAAAAANNNYYAPPPPPPAYGPGYGRGGYGPGYVPAAGPGYYGPVYNYRRPRCLTQTQTFYNRWGRPYYRDVEVCR
ncbi:hypothetical protein [Ancylobacter pratisalsi]|uniref:Lectin-like protein BA14k n=1 Tax=Ancylobacter pratisalsi TaxID=1745854 RepID=A0A6P1YNN3_9HYPH|nr:hypothetical protein [Ancylobacter pratisalsi]QIB35067.1 hypothetical protein G3A50_16135 [Ancylobacter pratisalsi]